MNLLNRLAMVCMLPLIAIAAAGCCGTALKRSPEPSEYSAVAVQNDLLSAATFRKILIEVDFTSGCRPSDRAVESVVQVLAEFCDKPWGIRVVLDGEIPGYSEDSAVSDAKCRELRKQFESLAADAQTAKVYILFIPHMADHPHGEKGSRGWCEGNFIVIAREELRRYSFLHITLAKIEETVLIHEFGHAMGLVSNPAHDYRHHCTNPSCVMYYEPDFRCIVANSVSAVFGSLPTDFCDECRADLRRLREGK